MAAQRGPSRSPLNEGLSRSPLGVLPTRKESPLCCEACYIEDTQLRREVIKVSAAVAESTPPSMVQRVTLIMESFDGRTSRRSLEDVAMRTGLPRSTAHRILDQLVQIGWLRHDQSGYSLGWRARQLGGPAHDVAVLREVAAPVLHDLATRTGLVVHFAVLDGPFALYLDKVGALSSAVPSRVGGQMVAFRTAVGRAMMARYKPEEVDELMTHRVRGSAVSPAAVTRVQQEL